MTEGNRPDAKRQLLCNSTGMRDRESSSPERDGGTVGARGCEGGERGARAEWGQGFSARDEEVLETTLTTAAREKFYGNIC